MPLPDVDGTLARNRATRSTRSRPTASASSPATATGGWATPTFRPVMDELHRRSAVVHVHPTAANCCRNLEYAPGVGPGSLEYGTDTTRAITGVAFSGDAARYPGHPLHLVARRRHGAVPGGAHRRSVARRDRPDAGRLHAHAEDVLLRPGWRARTPARWRRSCSSCRRRRCSSAPTSRRAATAADYVVALRELKMFRGGALRAIERDNAVRLLPRLAAWR